MMGNSGGGRWGVGLKKLAKGSLVQAICIAEKSWREIFQCFGNLKHCKASVIGFLMKRQLESFVGGAQRQGLELERP